MRRYKNYSVEELAADRDFIRWVTNPEESDQDLWKTWLLTNPDQSEKVDAAVRLVKGVNQFFEVPVPAEQLETEKSKLLSRLEFQSGFKTTQFTRIAASFALLASFIAALWILLAESPEQEIVVQTNFGETKSITLPDNSIISLNANSHLSYSTSFENERIVELKGEAYFDIASQVKNGKKMPFTVLTSSGLMVEVLGTSFNINDRKVLPQVVLDHGKVLLSAVKNKKIQPITLQAGEMSELDEKNQNFVVKQVDPVLFTSWKDGILFFKEESLSNIALLLQQNYNLEMVFDSPGLKDRKFTGSTPSNELEVLITALEMAFQFEIEQQGNRIYLKENKSFEQ